MKFLVFNNKNGLGTADKLIVNWDSVKYIKPIDGDTFYIELNNGAYLEFDLSGANTSPKAIEAINRVVKANPNSRILEVKPRSLTEFVFSNIQYRVAASGSIDGSGTANEVAVFTDSNTISSISNGTSGQVLTSNGAGSDPSFQTLSTGPATQFDESLTNITTFGGPNNFIGKNIVQKAPHGILGDQPNNTIAFGLNVGNNSAGDNGLGGKFASNNILIGKDIINNQSTGTSFGFAGAANNTLIGNSIFNNFDDGSDARFAGDSVLIGRNLFSGSITGVTGSDAAIRSVIIGDSIATNVAGSINTKSQNILIGYDIESLGTTAAVSNQVVIGPKAFESAAGGDEVVAIGYRACAAGSANQTTAIGADAGRSNNLGQNSTVIGYNANCSFPGIANEFTLGNSSVGVLRCQQTTITSLSDERDKTSIEEIPYGLDFVDSLLPKRFIWDNRAEIRIEEDEDGNQIEVEHFSANKGKKDVGFIAQDLQTVDNNWLNLVYDANPEKLEASYGKLIPVLVKAIQELSAKVTALENA